MSRVPLAVRIAAIGLMGVATACGSGPAERPTTASAPALQQVTLPDLSGAAPPVRDQLEASYRSLSAATSDPNRSAADRADAYGRFGMLLMAAGDFEASEPSLANAETLAPGDRRWPYLLAHVSQRMGQVERAAERFHQALQLDPTNIAAHVWLARADLSLGRFEEADEVLARAVALAPDNAAVLAELGKAALARGDNARAVQMLTTALARDPMATALYHPIGIAYRGVGDGERAEQFLRLHGDVEVSLADPLLRDVDLLLASPMAYEIRGREALARGDWPAAIDQLQKGIGVAGENATLQGVLHQQLGTALFQTGDTAGALREFETAVRVAPESAKAQFSLGVLLESAGRHQEAIARLEAAVRADPRDVNARVQLAGALQRAGRAKEAEQQYAEAIKLDPNLGGRR